MVIIDEGRIVLDAPTRVALTEEELMKRAGLKPPQITQMAHGLADLGFPLHVSTVNEASISGKLPIPCIDVNSPNQGEKCQSLSARINNIRSRNVGEERGRPEGPLRLSGLRW